MNRNHQMVIVHDLINGLRDDVIRAIKDGRIPEEWDGFELRQYITDKAKEVILAGTMDRRRKREYRNTVLTNNL